MGQQLALQEDGGREGKDKLSCRYPIRRCLTHRDRERVAALLSLCRAAEMAASCDTC